jgi:hypothetical protein
MSEISWMNEQLIIQRVAATTATLRHSNEYYKFLIIFYFQNSDVIYVDLSLSLHVDNFSLRCFPSRCIDGLYVLEFSSLCGGRAATLNIGVFFRACGFYLGASTGTSLATREYGSD